MAILFNEDFENFFAFHAPEEMNEAGLRRQVDHYFQGRISTIFFCVNAQRAYFDSRVYEPAWQGVEQGADGKYYHRGVVVRGSPLPTLKTTLAAKLLNDTVDNPFQIRIDQCRRNGGKGALSIRINDCHLADEPASPMHSLLWADHPEWRLYEGLNYAVPEVRKKLLDFIVEVSERFDFDALELDWMRTPPFFPDGTEESSRPLADEIVRCAAQACGRAAKRTGHPVDLAVRVPSRPEEALALGLDVVQWAKRGWIQIVIPSAYIVSTDGMMPLEIWRALLPDEVKMAPGLDIVPRGHFQWCDQYASSKVMHNTAEIVQGFCADFYHRGAADVYLYNHMDGLTGLRDKAANDRMMQILGSPEAVEKSVRRHVSTVCSNWIPGLPFHSVLPLAPSAHWQYIRISIGGKVQGRAATLLCAFEANGQWNPDDLTFAVNGAVCPRCAETTEFQLPDPQWRGIVCAIPDGVLHDGAAVAGFRMTRPVDAVLHWCEIDLMPLPR